MSLAVAMLGALFLALSLAGVAYVVAAGVLVGRYRAQDDAPLLPEPHPAVAILKPLHGDEPGLGENLASFLAQDYPGEARVLMGVSRASDPARGVAEALAAAHPGRAEVVVDSWVGGANLKVANVMNLDRVAGGEVVILSDSDMRVRPDYLRRLVAALAAPGAGIASCLYHGRAALPGRWPQLAAMGVSYAFLPQQLLGVATGAKPCMGSTIALTRETLEAIGGFGRVKDVLADDYELGRAVSALGLDVVNPPFLVSHDSAEATLPDLWRQEVRWATTIRQLTPWGYASTLITHPLPLAAAGAMLAGFSPGAVGVLALAIVARLWLKSRVDAAVGASTGPWWLILARDILSIAVFAGAWSARRVKWRGAHFHVGRDGALTPV